VAQTAQRVIVMYAGKKVEEASVDDLFADPAPSLYPRPDGLDAGRDRARAKRTSA
jgi:peptide/nickel transport system ATP-binding protein